MKRNARWNYYFLLAAFVVCAALWRAGVPVLPVVLGTVLAGVYNWYRSRQVPIR